MPAFIYLEESGDLSPTTANFSNNGQSCSATYLFAGPTFDQLRSSVLDLLGFTDTRVGDGRIKRTLPARHPAYQWMFADSCSPQGVGAAFTLVNPSPGKGSPIIPDFPLYGAYHYRVNFSPRPYNVWQNKDIEINRGGLYYTKNDTGQPPPGSPTPDPAVKFKFATEWHRFTTWDIVPTNQFIHAQQGQMKFRASGVGGGVPPDNFPFQDSPKLYLPDSMLKVRWYEVPYRYMTSPNSFLRKFVGHINQNDFSDGPTLRGTKPQYPAGSLLYLGANPLRIYTPPIPDEGLLAFNFSNGFVRSRLCDLELNFLYTARTRGTETGNTPNFNAINRNWIVAGHNLLPWLTTRKYYYATSYDPNNENDKSKWFPMYNSFPFELLFTDPDAQEFNDDGVSLGAPLLDP